MDTGSLRVILGPEKAPWTRSLARTPSRTPSGGRLGPNWDPNWGPEASLWDHFGHPVRDIFWTKFHTAGPPPPEPVRPPAEEGSKRPPGRGYLGEGLREGRAERRRITPRGVGGYCRQSEDIFHSHVTFSHKKTSPMSIQHIPLLPSIHIGSIDMM